MIEAIRGIKVKTIIAMALIIFLSSCGDGFNPVSVRAAAAADHAGAEIAAIPGSHYIFLVRKQDGSVWYVEYMGATVKQTAAVLIFNPR